MHLFLSQSDKAHIHLLAFPAGVCHLDLTRFNISIFFSH